ncbi:MAG: hypothetical protein GXY48_05270 [Methanomicrobiales archaeon]|nr:hypothetical protein [Methanomicrobiales archaeon]
MRHLLKGIITSLAHDIEGAQGYTQIHKLISEIIYDFYKEQLANNPAELKKLKKVERNKFFFFKKYKDHKSRADILRERVSDWIIHKNVSIDPHFINLLFAFCNPNLRNIAFQRLIGNIADSEDAHKLDIPFLENISESTQEAEARDYIISLGLILANYRHFLVVCFDQLENLHEKDQIRAFGEMTLTLINECKSMIPLTMSRTLHWEMVIEPALDRNVVDRLKGNNFILLGCIEEEVQKILKSRIQLCLPDDWENAYNWLYPRINNRLNASPSPRDVITAANQIIQQNELHENEPGKFDISYSTPDEILGTAFQNERDQILSDMSSWPPDYEELTEAVKLFLNSRDMNVTSNYVPRKSVLFVKNDNKNCCIIVNTNPNHSTIGSCFVIGLEYLNHNPNSTCIYLTDPRCIVTKPSWVQANERKDAFLKAGGRIMQPKDGDIAKYYTLYSLYCKVTEGDLLIKTNEGSRSISKDELMAYIGNKDLFP